MQSPWVTTWRFCTQHAVDCRERTRGEEKVFVDFYMSAEILSPPSPFTPSPLTFPWNLSRSLCLSVYSPVKCLLCIQQHGWQASKIAQSECWPLHTHSDLLSQVNSFYRKGNMREICEEPFVNISVWGSMSEFKREQRWLNEETEKNQTDVICWPSLTDHVWSTDKQTHTSATQHWVYACALQQLQWEGDCGFVLLVPGECPSG